MDSNDSSLLLLVHKKGIYHLSENNNLDLLNQLDIDKTYRFDNGTAPYITVDKADDLQIFDKTIFVIHNLPFITKININKLLIK
jgi:hypothetical protein